MLKAESLNTAVELCLFSGHIKYEKPLSMLIIALAESGKTSAVKKYRINNGIAYKSDFTPFGLMRDVVPLVAKGEVKHLICPDLLKPLSRRTSIVKETISFLNSLIEDGVIDASTFFTGNQMMGVQDTLITDLRCGLIGCITKDSFFEHMHDWVSMGFMRRIMPFTFSYTKKDIMDILDSIIDQKHHEVKPISLKFPKKLVDVKIDPKFGQQIKPFTIGYAKEIKAYGFSAQKQFQTLMKASALRDGRREVNDKDFEILTDLLNYLNTEFNKL